MESTGAIDPGQEYLIVVTGTNNPGASVTNYNLAIGANLRVEKMESVPTHPARDIGLLLPHRWNSPH